MSKFATLTFIALALLLIQVQSQADFKRTDQSCKDNHYLSWYFSGQQCMQCYQSWSQNNQCHKCNEDKCDKDCYGGFSTFETTSTYMDNNGASQEYKYNYCRHCGSNDSNNIQSCCFFESAANRLNKNDTHKLSSSFSSQSYHATACRITGNVYLSKDNDSLTTVGSGMALRQVGSACIVIANCREVSEYGKCNLCLDGYYLNDNLECTACHNKSWENFIVSTNSENRDKNLKSFIDNLGVETNNGCQTCTGPNQCSTCKVGYFMATNINRDVYDLNLSRNASFCRKCNDNCTCNDASDFCVKCISDSYYKDPKTNSCKPCSGIDGNTTQYCNKCEYNEDLELPVCTGCAAWDSNGTYKVVEFIKSFYYLNKKDTTSATSQQGNKSYCLPCNEVYAVTAQDGTDVRGVKVRRIKTQWVQASDKKSHSYSIENGDGIDNVNPGEELFIYDNQDDEEMQKTKNACVQCEIDTNSRSYNNYDDTNKSFTNEVTQNKQFRFVKCNQDKCKDGYVEEMQPLFAHKLKITNQKDFVFYKINSHFRCQRCQKMVSFYDDRQFNSLGDSDKQKTNAFSSYNRVGLVRRCKRSDNSAFTNSFEITQCGSYISAGNYFDTVNETEGDNHDAGNIEFVKVTSNGGTNTYAIKKPSQQMTQSAYSTYFSGNLKYFKTNVNVSGASTVNSMLKNICVENKNRCKKIRDLIDIKGASKVKGAADTFSSDNDPRCSECFPGYILTQDSTCVYCPSTKNEQGSSSNNNDKITKGCSKCMREEYTKDVIDKQGNSKIILCADCHNGWDYTDGSQGYKDDTALTTARSTNSDTDRNNLNYFYDSETKTCTPCNKGCKTCSGLSATCKEAQKYFRVTNDTKLNATGTKFELCSVDFCQKCDEGINTCTKCDAGFALIQFKQQEGQASLFECERCERNCLACKGDATATPYQRKSTCTECAQDYYLKDGLCYPIRANCINYAKNGGDCVQCGYGYRLEGGWCYKCIVLEGGFYDCPNKCDSQLFITAYTSNVRTSAELFRQDQLTYEKYPKEDAKRRILRILEENSP